MRRVILESPYAAPDSAGIQRNLDYARACLRDCLERGEAPIASHLLYTQPGVLDDKVPEEREWGILAGLSWADIADLRVFYVDRGWSPGMRFARAGYDKERLACEERLLPGYDPKAAEATEWAHNGGLTVVESDRYQLCSCGAEVDTESRSQCDECGRTVDA